MNDDDKRQVTDLHGDDTTADILTPRPVETVTPGNHPLDFIPNERTQREWTGEDSRIVRFSHSTTLSAAWKPPAAQRQPNAGM
ncbi:hypothetical protein ABVT39_024453 [Epinephelus coioides]